MPTTFTIAIPTHNRRETALLAARSALAQTRPPDQLLVLCDGCTDGTAEAMGSLGDSRVEALQLAKAPDYGYAHRNRSLKLARGEAILWLADDDLLLPDHLERIGELWDTERFDLVQSHGVVVHPDDSLEWFGSDWSVPASLERLAGFNSNPMASVSLRVAVALDVGGWNPELRGGGDWDLWRRALGAGGRSARSLEPTILHFRAKDREQAWPMRVQQNTEWLDRLSDPESLLNLRIALRRAEAEQEAALRHHAETVQAQLDATRLELSAATAYSAEVEEKFRQADQRAIGLGATLTDIYEGSWWRLRRRLLPLLRLLGRGR